MIKVTRVNANRALRIALIFLVILIVALASAMIVGQYRAARQAAEVQVHRNAHLAATQFSWIFQAADQALQRIQNAVMGPATRPTQLASIDTAVQNLPEGLQYSLYDRDGHLILTSQLERHMIDVSDRAYFQRLRAGEIQVFEPMLTERLSGRHMFIIARRIGDANGFQGVATIAIPLDYLHDTASTLFFNGNATLSLVGLDGWVIARSPQIAPVNLFGTPSYAALMSGPNGTYSATSPADGQQRIVGFWRIDDWPVIAVAGVNVASVMQLFFATVRTELAILIPLLVGVVVMVIWLFGLLIVDERRARALAVAQQRSDFLLKEIHHRVKNNLQAVMSLIRLQRLPDTVTESLLGRISAMVEVHREIYSGETLDRIKGAPYLRRLVGNIARGYDNRITLDLLLAEIDVSGDLAMHLGLLTNELLTNAFKHAFPDGRSGRIEIALSQEDTDHLRLTIRDNGAGVDPDAQRNSMGSKLISALVSQMRGEMSVETDDGYCATIVFPTDLETIDA